jgi:asparagine synthetase B (glutamine-hydrolysing)
MNKALPDTLEEDPTIPAEFLQVLTTSLSVRTRTIPHTHTHFNSCDTNDTRVAILFSGGLDCSVLAWLIHTLLPPHEPIDLINVAFENPRTVAAQKTRSEDVYNVCPDRITGHAGWEELCILSADQGRKWRFIEVPFPSSSLISSLD